MNSNNISTLLTKFCYFVAFFLLSNSQADKMKDLPITAETQYPWENTCWAADCDMILRLWNFSIGQTAIIVWAVGGLDLTNLLFGTTTSCDKVLAYFSKDGPYGAIPTQPTKSDLPYIQIEGRIEQCEPIIAGWETNATDAQNNPIKHAVLIYGYEQYDETPTQYANQFVDYCDPWTGCHEFYTYEKFKSYTDPANPRQCHTWIESLELTYSGPACLIGVLDNVKITSGTTAFTYPGSYGTYNCQFSSNESPPAHATNFNWSLSFEYSGGTKVVASASTTGTDISSWNTPLITLPSGYPWIRDENGLVTGRVVVSTVDSDGFPHSDFKLITYAEQYPYPSNIPFESQVVSSSHADVIAHDEIQLINDQITNTGAINFKAGQEIFIGPETQILPGSSVSFTIVPSLQ